MDYFLSEIKLSKMVRQDTPNDRVNVKKRKSYLSNMTLVNNHHIEAPIHVKKKSTAKIIKKIIDQTNNIFLISSNIFYFKFNFYIVPIYCFF